MSRSLTGGTGDVNPQILYFQGTQPLPDGIIVLTIPIPRVFQGGGSRRATIIEILKCWFWSDPSFNLNQAGAQTFTAFAQLATKAHTAITVGDPTIFADVRWANSIYQPAVTQALARGARENPQTIDFTDGAGHGLLIATDNIYFVGDTTGATNNVTFEVRILYRFKQVGLEEYIGIVQSQQT
jgi:hypothetical protein